VLDSVELSPHFSLVELPAPAAFVGRTLRDIGLRARYGLTTIAIKHMGRDGAVLSTNIAPGPDDAIQEGDVLALLGSNENRADFDRMLQRAGTAGASTRLL